MCGEKQVPRMERPRSKGSPPHMRGKAGRLRGLQAGTGITPAHAGKSICSLRLNMLHRDHPRTCGEKFDRFLPSFIALGSPPHMRGKGFLYFAHEMLEVDHPRTCGEKKLAQFEDETGTGSPPHMRGKVPPPRYSGTCTGITPAHAGKSRAAVSKTACCRGSPPHMRGKGKEKARTAVQGGITPAHAGKSYIRPALLLPEWDHPRTCGEKTICGEWQQTFGGSPPHMRGKDFWHYADSYETGITPAHAGKSPRSLATTYGISGSPPHMRGKD